MAGGGGDKRRRKQDKRRKRDQRREGPGGRGGREPGARPRAPWDHLLPPGITPERELALEVLVADPDLFDAGLGLTAVCEALLDPDLLAGDGQGTGATAGPADASGAADASAPAPPGGGEPSPPGGAVRAALRARLAGPARGPGVVRRAAAVLERAARSYPTSRLGADAGLARRGLEALAAEAAGAAGVAVAAAAGGGAAGAALPPTLADALLSADLLRALREGHLLRHVVRARCPLPAPEAARAALAALAADPARAALLEQLRLAPADVPAFADDLLRDGPGDRLSIALVPHDLLHLARVRRWLLRVASRRLLADGPWPGLADELAALADEAFLRDVEDEVLDDLLEGAADMRLLDELAREAEAGVAARERERAGYDDDGEGALDAADLALVRRRGQAALLAAAALPRAGNPWLRRAHADGLVLGLGDDDDDDDGGDLAAIHEAALEQPEDLEIVRSLAFVLERGGDGRAARRVRRYQAVLQRERQRFAPGGGPSKS